MPILFFLFWVILNARITLEVIIFGILISTVVSLFCYRFLNYDFKNEIKLSRNMFKALAYVGLLVIEIVKSNIYMIRLILSKKSQEIEPEIVYFKSPVKTSGAKVALANSITLTPGTITVHLEGDRFGVHAIDKSLADDLESSNFVKRLQEMEKEV